MIMTKIVLHGGRVGEKTESNRKFFAEFTSDVSKPVVKVAMCYWARSESEWQKTNQRDEALIRQETNKGIETVLVKDTNHLQQIMPECEVLYVAGGEVTPIQQHVASLTWLPEALRNKTYIGSSMGAFVASVAYVASGDGETADQTIVLPGFGLVPVTTLCHFNVESKKQEKIELLRAVYPSLPVVTLDEFEWVRLWI